MHTSYAAIAQGRGADCGHHEYMQTRRDLLGFLAGAGVSAAYRPVRGARSRHPGRAPIRAIAFDLFTIFDPRSVIAVAESIAPGRARELSESWRVRQFEYCWLHAAAGTYRDFHALTDDALMYAARVIGVRLSTDARRTLVGSYERLAPWPDAREALQSMKGAGLRLAPLANFTPTMIENLLANAGLRPLFDVLISTDRAKTFKPDPRAYALGPSVLGLRREEIAYAAFGGWDAAGAKWFGYPTFWVNPLGVPTEELPPGPDAVGTTLREVASWVAAR
jgi:2-haloacid dehalogenase